MSENSEIDHMLVTHYVGGEKIQMSLAQKNYLIKNQYIIEPIRLVMIQWKDNCQFCTEPNGPSDAKYVGIQSHMGFISCPNCMQKMNETYNEWMDKNAYGDAKILLGRNIKVLRSSGEFENDWELNPYDAYVLIDANGEQIVSCKKIGEDLNKHCNVKMLIEWNS